jgi:flavin reductase (DIM6/NTAB) family NADH-FMN oxidoreductase RutF
MLREVIPVESFCANPTSIWDEGWFLLTAGRNKSGAFNTMTVSWGAFGTIWSRPMAQVVVRPTRYTHEFMERSESFTLCAFPAARRNLLAYCGSHSGRDVDKVEATGLTPVASTHVDAPGFDEAELIIECRKIYHDRLNPEHFLASYIEPHYPEKDYHHVYYGEIVAVHGSAKYAGSTT